MAHTDDLNFCRIGLLLVLLFFLGGCSVFQRPSMPTVIPSEYVPTAMALTIEAMDGAPSATPTLPPVPVRSTYIPTSLPQIPTPTPSLALTLGATLTSTPRPTATRTATATPELPFADIQILDPGPASMVTSPITLKAYLTPGDRGRITVELLGEDERLLVRKVLAYVPGNRVHVREELEFEIPGVAEAGRLRVLTEDSVGRTISLASVDLVLLALGDEDLNPPGDLLEPVIIHQPVTNSLIQGGTVMVTGRARLAGAGPLYFDLVTIEGKPAGATRLLAVPEAEAGQHVDFSVDVPYSVSEPTWVRLTITERAGRIPGITYLTSMIVLLSP